MWSHSPKTLAVFAENNIFLTMVLARCTLGINATYFDQQEGYKNVQTADDQNRRTRVVRAPPVLGCTEK